MCNPLHISRSLPSASRKEAALTGVERARVQFAARPNRCVAAVSCSVRRKKCLAESSCCSACLLWVAHPLFPRTVPTVVRWW